MVARPGGIVFFVYFFLFVFFFVCLFVFVCVCVFNPSSQWKIGKLLEPKSDPKSGGNFSGQNNHYTVVFFLPCTHTSSLFLHPPPHLPLLATFPAPPPLPSHPLLPTTSPTTLSPSPPHHCPPLSSHPLLPTTSLHCLALSFHPLVTNKKLTYNKSDSKVRCVCSFWCLCWRCELP